MQPQDEIVQTLVNLKLTVVQAKVYIALAKLGTSTAKPITKEAHVASQDVYRVLGELQEKGLVQKLIAKPAMYKATPINEGLPILLQNKKEEYTEIEKQVKKVAKDFQENLNQNIEQEELQFSITSEWMLLSNMHEKMSDATEKRIAIILPGKISERRLFRYSPSLKRAMRRGVKIRLITETNDGEAITKNKNREPLSKEPTFEQRYLPKNNIQFGMHIFDEQEVTLALSEKKPMLSLWTNNAHVAKLAGAYFENLWNTAQ
jgi:sugar-specific transcriptional regulator TrmB